MSQRYLIKGVHWVWNPDMFFSGFILDGINGDVDPIVGGDLIGGLPDTATIEQWNEWAKQQVGKYLVCDEIIYKAFATRGKTRIEA